ncbi:methyl-accepting chemotaxis protein [Paenibacillus nasutitermitis]|uniref:Chemotaxis protein n=1 Tax=Paenibacillus nasutitermitis TaxID=1652958 RepID=A0A917E148_9BACL|nr:methyl-accepting chemotaxis protein [Paenibacillus nasutitermitis]GGD87268.1 chemotaxis protein [Paenibacillus nasutitermitis]
MVMVPTKKKKKVTIRFKLLLVSLLLLMTPVLTLGIISYQVTYKETDRLIRKNLTNSVRMAIEMTASLEQQVKEGTITNDEAQEHMKQLLLGPKQGDKREINSYLDLGESGYFYVLDKTGDLLAHPQMEGQNIAEKQTSDGFFYIKDVIEKGLSGGGFTFYDWPLPGSTKEAEKIVYAEASPNWGWIIAAGSYMQDYNTGQKNIRDTIIITLICCWVAGSVLMTLFARHISMPVRKLAGQAKLFSTGDLRTADLHVGNKDELGDLAASFQEMYGSLRNLASGLLKGSDSLAVSARELSGAIEQTTQATDHIAESVQESASSSEVQARSIRESSKAMEEMATGIQRVAATSAAAFESSAMTLEEARQGSLLLAQSSEQMASVNITVDELAAMVTKLGERSQQIGEIVEVITDLSTQTNLLSLNASIEAARAGEHGKGFAVVAGEVKKLAERSRESAEQVAELIQTIQADIGHAGAAMEKGEHEVREGTRSIQLTSEALTRILDATRSVVDQVQESSAAAQQMSASSQEIAASLQEIDRLSEKSNDLAQSISASAEEQLASMEELGASAETLSDMSKEMQALAHRFKL